MKNAEYISLDGVGIAELIRKKEVTPREVLISSMHQLEKVNGELNAATRTRFDAALTEIEQLNHVDSLGRLDGVPIVLKDLAQSIAGEENIAGSSLLKGTIAPQTAHIVKGYQASGCVPIAYSATPEFGLKNITEAKVYGATRNPWHTDYSPGGSSGGSAALVSSGVVPIAGSSDGGGSIRIPASFTGLFGLKPTRGRTPVGPGVGRQWQGAAIDFVLTKSVRDSARMLDQLQVFQEAAAFHIPLYEGSYEKVRTEVPKRKYKIGFSMDSPVGTKVSEDAKTAVRKMVRWLEDEGHIVEEVDNGIDGKQLMRDYFMMNSGEIAALMGQLESAFQRKLKANEVEMETWMLHIAGKNVTAAEFSASLASWDVAAAKMAEFHQKYDFYVTPATAYTAPKIGELTPSAETEAAYKADIERFDPRQQQEFIYDMFLPSLSYTPFTQLANLTGQPAISVPVHVSQDTGLPIGVQVMARKGGEHELLQLAYQLEETDLWQGLKGNPYFT